MIDAGRATGLEHELTARRRRAGEPDAVGEDDEAPV
jgi:hypothetical protein